MSVGAYIEKQNPLTVAAAITVAGVLVWLALRGFKGVARGASKAIVDTAAGAIEGTVVGVGEAVGIPQTNMSECERALAEGRTWDASFACPAGTFIKGLFSKPTNVGSELLP